MKKRIGKVIQILNLKKINIAKSMGVAPSTISNWVMGKKRMSSQSINHFCQLYNINKEWLLTGEGVVFTKDTPQSVYEEMWDRNIKKQTQYLLDIKSGKIKYDQEAQKRVELILEMQEHLFEELKKLGVEMDDD